MIVLILILMFRYSMMWRVAFLWNTHSPNLLNHKYLDPQIHLFHNLLLLISNGLLLTYVEYKNKIY